MDVPLLKVFIDKVIHYFLVMRGKRVRFAVMGNKTRFEVYCMIVWSCYKESVCCLFFKDTAEVMEVIWQEFIEVDWILLIGIPFSKFLSWVGGANSD